MWVGAERVNRVRLKRVDRHVGRALLQFECARGVVRNDVKTDAGDRGLRLPTVLVALEDHILVLLLRDEPIGAGSDGVPPEVFAAARRYDAECAVGEIPQQ